MHTSRYFVLLTLCGGLFFTGCGSDDKDPDGDGWSLGGDDMTVDPDMMTGQRDMAPDQSSVPDMSTGPVDMKATPDQGNIRPDMPSPPDMGAPDMEQPPDMEATPDMPVMTTGPDLAFPQRVTFARVAPGTRAVQLLTLANRGSEPLSLDDLIISPAQNSPFSFSIVNAQAPDDESQDTDTWPDTLASGEALQVRIAFEPENEAPVQARLFVRSNDPDTPTAEIVLEGNTGTPCVRLGGVQQMPAATTDFDLAFGTSQVGVAQERTITIENCSRNQDLTVSNVALTDDSNGEFAITQWVMASPGSNGVVISPLASETLKVSYTPSAETGSLGRLEINTDDPTWQSANIKLTGQGSTNACPVANATAIVQGAGGQPQQTINTAPLSTVEFSGAGSTDPDGTIQRYEWSIINKPAGSTTLFTPSSGALRPRLFIDLAGQYEVELTVYDDQGQASCASSTVLINAVHSQDVGIELVWDTPADPDQTDTFGTDLDLHYKLETATWNSAPGDINWRNITADWLPMGPTNDASLDIDDTDGSGPEFISHNLPSPGTYNIGVYYYNDNGYSASYATVRVYVSGMLTYENVNKYMERENIFWYVADIDGTSLMVNDMAANQITVDFPMAP